MLQWRLLVPTPTSNTLICRVLIHAQFDASRRGMHMLSSSGEKNEATHRRGGRGECLLCDPGSDLTKWEEIVQTQQSIAWRTKKRASTVEYNLICTVLKRGIHRLYSYCDIIQYDIKRVVFTLKPFYYTQRHQQYPQRPSWSFILEMQILWSDWQRKPQILSRINQLKGIKIYTIYKVPLRDVPEGVAQELHVTKKKSVQHLMEEANNIHIVWHHKIYPNIKHCFLGPNI